MQLSTELDGQMLSRNLYLQKGHIAIIGSTVIEDSQSGTRKGDPEAGNHIKVTAKVKMQAK
jgi:hypothetical protein